MLSIAFFVGICYNLPIQIREVWPLPTVILLIGSVLCAAFYLYVYFAAETPRKGTLEWVEMYEKPKMTRQFAKPFRWWDSLWALLALVLACGFHLGVGACVDPGMLRTSLLSGYFLLSLLPVAMAAAAAYLTAKLLTGNVLLSLLSALLMPCSLAYSDAAPFVLGSFLLLLLQISACGWKSWLFLVLSALLLAAGTYGDPALFLLALPWLGCILAGEVIRIWDDETGPWHLILSLLTFAAVLSVGAMAANIPNYLQFFQNREGLIFADGNLYAMFWMRLLGHLQMPGAESLPPTELPSLTVALAAVVYLADSLRKRRDLSALALLLLTVFAIVLRFLYTGAILAPAAVLALAYLTNRIRIRNFPGAAVVVALVPILITLTGTILTLTGGFTQ